MDQQLILALTIVFIGVAVLSGLVASLVLARSSPERRRLREMATATAAGSIGLGGAVSLTDKPDAVAKRVTTFVPKSPKEMGRLQKRLTRAGFRHTRAAVYFAMAEVVLPIVFALATICIARRIRAAASSRCWRRASATRCLASGWRTRRRSARSRSRTAFPTRSTC